MGVVTSASQFFRQIGSTVGTALFGALLTARLAGEMIRHGGATARGGLAQLQALAANQEGAGAVHVAVDPLVRAAFAVAMTNLFEASLVVVILALLAILAIPQVELRKSHVHAEAVAEPGEGTSEMAEA